jgi:type II secretory pathway pseudopilin PulG
MVELLVVISIILILIALAVAGLKLVVGSTADKATRTTMENLLAMQSAYDAVTRGVRPIKTLVLGDATATPVVAPLRPTSPYYVGKVSVDAPQSMTPVAIFDRTESLPTMAAGQALVALAQIPENKQSMLKFSPSVSRIVTNVWSNTATYNPGDRIRYDGGINGPEFFECLVSPAVGMTPVVGTNWKHTESTMMDGFNNPIVYVPAGQSLVIGTYKGAYSAGNIHVGDTVQNGTGYAVCIKDSPPSPTAPLDTNYWQNAAIVSPDGRPFWASAGLDGDFGKPGDNIYSFQH